MKQKLKKAVIPAADLGTRFLPITKAMPKEIALADERFKDTLTEFIFGKV